jgi:hypothetical protein
VRFSQPPYLAHLLLTRAVMADYDRH